MKRFLGMAGVSVFLMVFAFVMEADAGCFRRGGSGWGFPVARAFQAMRDNRQERVANRIDRRQARRAARSGGSYSSVEYSSTVTTTNSGGASSSAPAGCASCVTNSVGYYDSIVNPVVNSSAPAVDCSSGVCVPLSTEVWKPVEIQRTPEVVVPGDVDPVNVPSPDDSYLDGVDATVIPDGREVTSVRHRTRCIWLE